MKYANSSDGTLETSHIEETSFDRTGNRILNEKEKSFAKVTRTTNRSQSSEKYSIRVHDSVPYDPWGMFGHRDQYLATKMKTVSRETFDFYMLFLKTRNSLYMTKAQRSFIND